MLYFSRQDMLTLQVIRIMDHIWHTEGMDLRMTPYTCLATGPQVGVIEVVRDAKTVYQIQRKASRLAAIQVTHCFVSEVFVQRIRILIL
jgi:phosphatidylinositol-4,5-bisphosphate 3-kinase catalytic subunit alpha/beta/delta